MIIKHLPTHPFPVVPANLKVFLFYLVAIMFAVSGIALG